MRSRDLKRLIGTDTLVDVVDPRPIPGWSCIGGKVTSETTDNRFRIDGEWVGKSGKADTWFLIEPRDIRPHVDGGAWAKKKASPAVGTREWAIEQSKKGKEIRHTSWWNKSYRIRLDGDKWLCNNDVDGLGSAQCVAITDGTWEIYEEPKTNSIADDLGAPTKATSETTRDLPKTISGRIYAASEATAIKSTPTLTPNDHIRDAVVSLEKAKLVLDIEIGRLKGLLK